MSNLLKMSIVVFSSLENFPVIPIFPDNLVSGASQLFLAFNSSGSGHYDYVTFVSGESSKEKVRHKPSLEQVKQPVSCTFMWRKQKNRKRNTEYLQ